MHVLHQAERVNRSKNIEADLEVRLKGDLAASEKMPAQATWWSLWRNHRDFLNMTAVHCAWAIYVTNYNGMLLNVKAFGRDFLSVNTILMGSWIHCTKFAEQIIYKPYFHHAGVSEIIGVLIGLMLILKTNRKWKWAGGLNIVFGCLCATGFLLPDSCKLHILSTKMYL